MPDDVAHARMRARVRVTESGESMSSGRLNSIPIGRAATGSHHADPSQTTVWDLSTILTLRMSQNSLHERICQSLSLRRKRFSFVTVIANLHSSWSRPVKGIVDDCLYRLLVCCRHR